MSTDQCHDAPSCRRCLGERWVCEEHPDDPFPHDNCPGPGDPCPACNADPNNVILHDGGVMSRG